MPFANSNVSDLIAAGIDNRTGELADNVLNHNPVFAQFKAKGRVKTASGGVLIMEELSFDQNGNTDSYDGYDPLSMAPTEEISAARYDWKQYSSQVVISGRQLMINSGKEAVLDLVEEKIEVANSSLANRFETDLHGDGTGNGGKNLTGLGLIVENTVIASQTSTVGEISRTTWPFWRNHRATGNTNTAATIQSEYNTMWANLTRGSDAPDLVLLGSQQWGRYLASLQALQRFTQAETGKLGFPTLKFMTADVYLGGGIGGVMPSTHALFLNTKYLRFRPHAQRNFVSGPRKDSFNQDAYGRNILFMGNVTCRGSKFQGRHVSAD